MEEKGKVDELLHQVRGYFRTQYELAVLTTVDRLSGAGASLVSGLVIGMISFVTVLLLCFSAAYYLSDVIGDPYAGFLIIGGGFLMLLFIFLIFRKQLLVRPFRNKIIRKAFENA